MQDRCVLLYNQQLPQSAFGSKTPVQAMKDWHTLRLDVPSRHIASIPAVCHYSSQGLRFVI